MKLQNAGPLQWNVSARGAGAQVATRAAVSGVVHVCTGVVLEFHSGTAGNGCFWGLSDSSGNVYLEGYMYAQLANAIDRVIVTGINLPAVAGASLVLQTSGIASTDLSTVNLMGYDL